MTEPGHFSQAIYWAKASLHWQRSDGYLLRLPLYRGTTMPRRAMRWIANGLERPDLGCTSVEVVDNFYDENDQRLFAIEMYFSSLDSVLAVPPAEFRRMVMSAIDDLVVRYDARVSADREAAGEWLLVAAERDAVLVDVEGRD